jgi:hypothetical protein
MYKPEKVSKDAGAVLSGDEGGALRTEFVKKVQFQ